MKTQTQTQKAKKNETKAVTAPTKAIPFFIALKAMIEAEKGMAMVRAFIARAAQHHGQRGTTFPRPHTEAARAAVTEKDVREYLVRISKGEGKAVAGSTKGQAIFDLLMIGADLPKDKRIAK
jgi:hypothetical protein